MPRLEPEGPDVGWSWRRGEVPILCPAPHPSGHPWDRAILHIHPAARAFLGGGRFDYSYKNGWKKGCIKNTINHSYFFFGQAKHEKPIHFVIF